MVADGDGPGEDDPEYEPDPFLLVTVRIMLDVAPGSLECDANVSVLWVVADEECCVSRLSRNSAL